MIVLGIAESKDRKGTELEQLTCRLLESMGYVNVLTNRIDSGGSEIDVSADFVVPTLGTDVRHRIICECKAYKSPVDTTAWLKFLGKLYQEQSLLRHEAFGCLIALAGVNGAVAGSYDKLPQRGHHVHLVSGEVLAGLVKKTFEVSDAKAVLAAASALSDRTHRTVELAYYGGKVYWVVLYEDDQYTILDGTGGCLPLETTVALRPLVEAEIAAGTYLDLREEARAKSRAEAALKALVGGMMEGGGSADLDSLKAWYSDPVADPTEPELLGAASELCRRGWLLPEGETRWCFSESVEKDVTRLADIYRLFVSGGWTHLRPVGCVWYDSHIDDRLVAEACRVQHGVPLTPEEMATASLLMRWSPSALTYALLPDPMIVTHRKIQPASDEQMDVADRKHFLRSLYRAFVTDFESGRLAGYFHEKRGLREIERTQKIVVKGTHAIVHEGSVRQRTMVGQADTKLGGGFLMVLGLEDAPEPWERAKKDRPAPPETHTSEAT